MAADGVADENELETIKDIAEALDLDFDEIEKLRDKHLVDLNLSTGQQASIETILHIDPNSPKEQIKKKLENRVCKVEQSYKYSWWRAGTWKCPAYA